VSVLILSHRPEMLPKAIASVEAQTYRDFEICVKASVHWWPEKMNELARSARGRWIVPLCDDDELAPTFLERTVTEAEAANADLAYTDVQVIGEYMKLLGVPVQIRLPTFDAEVLRMHCAPFWTALVSRDLFERVGGYDGEQVFMDHDLWIRCCQAGARHVHLRGEFLMLIRHHGRNSALEIDEQEAWRLLRRKHSPLLAGAPATT
jgi:glycosyltransferase involved in cell wall biosynthesis